MSVGQRKMCMEKVNNFTGRPRRCRLPARQRDKLLNCHCLTIDYTPRELHSPEPERRLHFSHHHSPARKAEEAQADNLIFIYCPFINELSTLSYYHSSCLHSNSMCWGIVQFFLLNSVFLCVRFVLMENAQMSSHSSIQTHHRTHDFCISQELLLSPTELKCAGFQ